MTQQPVNTSCVSHLANMAIMLRKLTALQYSVRFLYNKSQYSMRLLYFLLSSSCDQCQYTLCLHAKGRPSSVGLSGHLNTKTVYPQMVNHLSTNPVQYRITLLMRATLSPLTKIYDINVNTGIQIAQTQVCYLLMQPHF